MRAVLVTLVVYCWNHAVKAQYIILW